MKGQFSGSREDSYLGEEFMEFKSWGYKGDYCFRLSTFLPLLQYCDFRQFAV